MSTRATYRCDCGWSVRRKAVSATVECEECHRLAAASRPTPGRPPAAPELARVELRCRPRAGSVELLGENYARQVAVEAIERVARTRRPAKS